MHKDPHNRGKSQVKNPFLKLNNSNPFTGTSTSKVLLNYSNGGKLYYDRAALPAPYMQLPQLLFKHTRSHMRQPRNHYKHELSSAEFKKLKLRFIRL